MTTIEKLEERKEELKSIMNDDSIEMANDYSIDNDNYFDDIVSEYADNNTSIYYNEQRQFYNDNVEFCEDAFKEFGYDIKEMFEDGMTLDDLVCKCGQIGEYKRIQDNLYEDIENIKLMMLLNYCIDNNITNITIEGLENIAERYVNDHTSDLLDELNELIEIIEDDEE